MRYLPHDTGRGLDTRFIYYALWFCSNERQPGGDIRAAVEPLGRIRHRRQRERQPVRYGVRQRQREGHSQHQRARHPSVSGGHGTSLHPALYHTANAKGFQTSPLIQSTVSKFAFATFSVFAVAGGIGGGECGGTSAGPGSPGHRAEKQPRRRHREIREVRNQSRVGE